MLTALPIPAGMRCPLPLIAAGVMLGAFHSIWVQYVYSEIVVNHVVFQLPKFAEAGQAPECR